MIHTIADAVRGRTIRWTFTEAPVGSGPFEHEFRPDGTVAWRVLEGPAKGRSGLENTYAALPAGDDVYAVSYLGSQGFTLTTVLNFRERTLVGFASNEREWHALRGTFEIVG